MVSLTSSVSLVSPRTVDYDTVFPEAITSVKPTLALRPRTFTMG